MRGREQSKGNFNCRRCWPKQYSKYLKNQVCQAKIEIFYKRAIKKKFLNFQTKELSLCHKL